MASRSSIAAVILVVVVGLACAGCYNPAPITICQIDPDTLPPAVILGHGDAPVFQDPGTIRVIHGSTCARSGDFVYITAIQDQATLPDWGTSATVFLNGWTLSYLGGDHHVGSVGVGLGKIRVDGRRLKWTAVGSLLDDGRDKAYSFCYHYTVIIWNDAQLDLVVDHGRPTALCQDNSFLARNDGMTTSLSSFPTFLDNPAFATPRRVAVLPRGFLIGWDSDHHLLQLAYNLDHSETFIAAQRYYKGDGFSTPILSGGIQARVDSGFVSWNSDAILKDNDSRRAYQFGELASGLGGRDVGVVQPPFAVLPYDGAGAFLGNGGIQHERIAIDRVPFRYAVPMLTGWELAYGRADRHVQQLGVWIDQFSYEPTPATTTGTLRYTLSTLLRDDGEPGYYARHKVTILGLRPIPGGGTTGAR